MARELQTAEGRLVLTESALAAVAGAAVGACEGVAATVARGLHDELAGLWRDARAPEPRQALERGVDVYLDAEQLRLRVDIAVVFGWRIQEVCRQVVAAVNRDVQRATGIRPTGVEVRVVGVRMREGPPEALSGPQG